MSLIKPAPVSIPFSTFNNYSNVLNEVVLTGSSHSPAITVITGIDVNDPGFEEGSSFFVKLVSAGITPTTAVLFQGFVYPQSQGNFQWRGELALFPSESLTFSNVSAVCDMVITGVYIPPLSLQP